MLEGIYGNDKKDHQTGRPDGWNFDVDKITEAIYKAARVLGGRDREMSAYLARQVELYLLEVCHNSTPTVEQIQDAVEKILIENGHARTA